MKNIEAENNYWALSAGFILMMLGNSCVTGSDKNPKNQNKDVRPYTEGIRIGWDYRTLTRVYDGSVSYPRIIRLENGDLLCAFESKGGVYITQSTDEGKSWNDAVLVAPPDGAVISAVPELLQLENGRIILAYNTRPPKDNKNSETRFGIKVRISDNSGSTWSSEQNVFEGGYQWHRGVWEPAMIQLNTGEIQLFFANEYPYENSNDQEISMVRSTDNGASWTNPKTISYRPGYRDGMPVPIILDDDHGIAVAIEDNGMSSNEFKPVIIWTSMNDNWQQEAVDGSSERRWGALIKEQRLAPGHYGGAPYIQQLPSGQTVLSFQSNQGRPGDWNESTMVVAIGDEEAQNFSRKSEPFDVSTNRSALWNSLFVKNDTTVTAISSTTTFSSSGRRELYIKDGYILDEMKAPNGTINIDGKMNEKIWEQGQRVFIGSRSPVNATLSAVWDAKYLYLGYSVVDSTLAQLSERAVDQQDGVAVMFATGWLTSDSLTAGTYKIYVTPSGKTVARQGRNGVWSDYDISVKASGTTRERNTKGYQLELAIPWSEIGGKPNVNEGWGINFELINYGSSAKNVTREVISGNIKEKPSTWSKIQLIQ